MSVHRYESGDGTRYRVRWREHDGRMRSRSFTGKSLATAFDAEVKARKFKGEALPRPGKDTLAVAYEDWFRLRGARLASTTQRTYRAVWNAHVRGRFDHYRLSELANDPQLFEELIADMREHGTGEASQRKVLVVISAVLTAAVDWKKIGTNPLWRMRKPPATRQRYPRPLPPVVIERIRLRITRRQAKDDPWHIRKWGEGCLVGLMAYAGLRPGEALALTWADVGEHSIAIDKALRDGTVAPTKTGLARTVPLAQPLKEDLDMLANIGGRDGDVPVVPSGTAGYVPGERAGYWSRAQFNNWRNRVWKPILQEATYGHAALASARPYDCRGSFVSLHLRAGASPLEVAQWAGHSPAVMFRHYANVIEDLRGEPIIGVEDQIVRARELVEGTATYELDLMIDDLIQHPTVASGGSTALVLYSPPSGD